MDIQTNGVRLDVEVCGSGPPVLFVDAGWQLPQPEVVNRLVLEHLGATS